MVSGDPKLGSDNGLQTNASLSDSYIGMFVVLFLDGIIYTVDIVKFKVIIIYKRITSLICIHDTENAPIFE